MKKQKHSEKNKKTDPVIEKKLLIRLSLIIAIFSFLIYSNTLHHGFVLDDNTVLKENTMTQGGISSLKQIFTSPYREGYPNADHNLYRPLSKAMFAVEWQLSPNNPMIHHFFNIFLYSLACILLFLVFLKWTKINVYILFFMTLLFAAHPIHTEVVANIKSRDEILTMIFILLSLNSLYKYINTQKTFSFISCLFCFFLALLSKESAIVYIGIIPLFIHFFTESPLKKNLQVTVSAIVIGVLYLIIHKSIIGSIGLTNIPVIDNSLLATSNVLLQKCTAIMILGRYLLLLIFPFPLSSDYSFNTIPIVSGMSDPAFLFSLIFHIFILVYAFKKFKEKHILSFCIFFYLISMSIASNIFMTIGTHLAERLLFLPSIAYCLALSYFIAKLFKINISEIIVVFNSFFRSAKSFIYITVVLLVVFSFKTIARNKDWKSNGTLFGKDIETVPNSAHMLMYYTDYLLNKDYLSTLSPEAKQIELLKAKTYIDKALKIYELFPDAHYLSGRVRYELKDYEGSYKEYNRAFSLNPETSKYHNDAGTSLFALGRFQEAGQEFEKAMKLNPVDPVPPFNLGSAYGAQGESFRLKQDQENMNKMFSQAIIYFKKAIQMKPDYKSAYNFLGTTYMNMGDTVNGQIYIQKAAQITTPQN